MEEVEDFDDWSAEKLARYLSKHGLGDYSEVIINHKITGDLAPLVTKDDLKEMGISVVGDRIRFNQALIALKRRARLQERTKVIWEGEERLYFHEAEAICWTCCGLCPDDPSTYKLTNNHLRIKLVKPGRIGPIPVCCWLSYTINNLDLTQIQDVDVIGIPASCFSRICCCAAGKDLIEIQSKTTPEPMQLVLLQGKGEEVSVLILNQVEEAQVIEHAAKMDR